jgi:hypothetical protein
MYAKLVCPAQTWTTATTATLFNAVIGVITGNVTATSSLDSSVFNQGASQIISTVAPGWTVHDTNAGTAISAGSTPVVIKAPYSDDGTKFKYIWAAPVYATGGTDQHWQWIPMENWDATANTSTNTLVTPPTTSQSSSSKWYSGPAYNAGFSNGCTFIISASANHLFVHITTGTLGLSFASCLYASEYTRDDVWNTVANGYPSWCFTGTNDNGVATSAANENGTVIRVLNIAGGGTADSNQVAAQIGTAYTGSNWGLTTRMRTQRIASSTFSLSNNPVGLSQIGTANNYWGNNYFARDSSKAQSLLLADIRLEVQSNGTGQFWIGGSLTTKAPYIYVFRSQWQSLDEVDIAGQRYTNLICNTPTPGTTSSTILVKQV